ncbi:SH3 type 3 domain-containing protein [Haloferula helveola]|uniref:SH3 type 3 domain-containing protein n=1 Tax=Haloferula helveola TaxID=490095 RepID=A0ABM7RA13_9BACT|nr:SH3 type 3 domain-containing protein [Haloferula helveola]
MKTSLHLLALAGSLALASCVVPTDGVVTARTTVYEPGYRVSTLPTGYSSVMVGGDRYYTHNGTYYRRRDNGYVVVESPRHHHDRYDHHARTHRDHYNTGAYVQTLPNGYRTITRNGDTYYHYDDSYFRRRGDGYVVVDLDI